MKLGTSGATPPAQAAAPALSPARVHEESLAVGRQQEDPHAALSVRALSILILLAGVLLLSQVLVLRLYGPLGLLGTSRALLGSGLVASGLGALALSRAGWNRASATLSLALALAALMFHAWYSGLGTHAIVLGGAVLLVAIAGILVNMATAAAMGVATALLIAGLEIAENRGLISAAAADAQLHQESRALSFAVLIVAALVTAWIVRRQLLATVLRARDQERRMSRLLGLGSDFTWEMDHRGHMTYLSPSFEMHTPHKVAEFMQLAKPGGPTFVKDAQSELLLADLKARRPYRDRVIHFVTADGKELFISGSGEPIFDPTGRHLGWWGVSRNATAEVLAQRELQRSQTMLDRLFRLSPDAVCVASMRDGRVLLANPAFLAFVGLDEAKVMGRNGYELGFWRDEEPMLALGRALAAQGWVRDFRSVAWSADGAQHFVLITAATFDWDGEPVTVMTTRDVTETERAKQEGDAILDNAVVGVCLVRNHRLERVNPQLERMLGLPLGSLVGKPTEVLFRDRDKFKEFVATYESSQVAGDTIDIERRVPRADGTKLLLRMRGRAVDPKRRQETGTIWVVEDITDRRRAELELADAQRDAEAASRAKSSFLATMSHEIRTPLSGVLGLARLLQDASLPTPRRNAYLAHLVDAAELLNGIVSDVLDLSKIEAGHLQVEQIPYDLHAVVWSAFRTFSPIGQERGLEMSCHVALDTPREVMGDPVRVRQILSNYLSNALKFTDRGRIHVHLFRRTPEIARIEISDTGIGVSPELRATLFQPFTQADSSTTRRFGGSGLGLSICRELATLMGGNVGLDSDGRTGSCAWVELPLITADEEDFSTIASPLDDTPQQPLHGMRVLLAEDNPVNRLIVGAMLTRLGAEVIEATNGSEAIEHASRESTSVHAILMDLHMPEVDGIEATRQLRAQPHTAHLPIIALTAAVLDAERAQAHAAGMNGFVSKPAGEGDLLRALWAYLPGAEGPPSAFMRFNLD
ncbi:PAS domain-containing hybrid sensor histidine kinase/response regulator [Scleromatobacter humisilvae]|uniref:Virulence sensor protein BvgS n=1 Tax=Scleromatobacter humisilvae TaxID=2897159 RepID=A0A9X1YP96_9BURK|nr:PAS domain-containing hybrid sensor histidine kinase/response regulator [Scleromatobacter humisilvae]MCK9688102.1 PAS domain S-box protein [Scleromatobacter humisilvae]